MVVKVLQNFAKEDCTYYQIQDVPGCCGRTHKRGVCTINYRGNTGGKTCSTQMKWCAYEPTGGKDPAHSP